MDKSPQKATDVDNPLLSGKKQDEKEGWKAKEEGRRRSRLAGQAKRSGSPLTFYCLPSPYEQGEHREEHNRALPDCPLMTSR